MVGGDMIWWQWVLVVVYLGGMGFFFWQSFWDDSERTDGFFFLGLLWPVAIGAAACIRPFVWSGHKLVEWRRSLISRKKEAARKQEEAAKAPPVEEEPCVPPPPPKDVLFRYAPRRYDPLAYDDGTEACQVEDGLVVSRDPELQRVVVELVLGSTDAKRHERVLANPMDLREMAHGLLAVAKKLEEGQGEPYR